MTLYLIPVPLNLTLDASDFLLPCEKRKISHLRHFFVETPKVARMHLKKLGFNLKDLALFKISEEFDITLLDSWDFGLLSDAGSPCLADPGAKIVSLVRSRGVEVFALVGSCSIFLALMLSGSDGQNFSFNGYLDQKYLKKILRGLEKSRRTEMFIENPYRNGKVVNAALGVLGADTKFGIFCDLKTDAEKIIIGRVIDLRKKESEIISMCDRKPSVFIIN